MPPFIIVVLMFVRQVRESKTEGISHPHLQPFGWDSKSKELYKSEKRSNYVNIISYKIMFICPIFKSINVELNEEFWMFKAKCYNPVYKANVAYHLSFEDTCNRQQIGKDTYIHIHTISYQHMNSILNFVRIKC